MLFLLITLISNAQTGKIEGRIYNDKNNEPLPFSNVVIEGTQIGTITNYDGNFIITGVEPGFIRLSISSLGFKPVITEELQIINNKSTYIEVGLEEASVNLSEVQITTSRFKKTVESPVSLRTLGASEIETSPGANRDISKVIQNLPGVAALPAAQRNDVLVRGGASNESRFYVDDVEIPYLNHFTTQGASGGPVGILNADFIREVDFYSGAFPANRGNALSGVFNFKQIDGNKDKMKFRGSIGASETSLTIDGPIKENTTYIFSVRRSYLQFLFKAIGLPFLPTFNDYQFKLRSKIDDNNEIKIISIGALDDFALDTKLKDPTEYQQYILNNLPVYNQWSYTFGAVYTHYRENGYRKLVLSRNMLNNRIYKYLENTKVDANKILDYTSQEIENKFRYENSIRADNNWKINYGVNFDYAKYNNSTFLKYYTLYGEDTLDYSSKIDFYNWGLFTQASRSFINDKLGISFGIRSDANSYSKEMNNLLDQISPRFSVSYKLTKKYSINFNTGRYYQRPGFTTLGYRDNQNNLINKENGIRYISADHLVGGIEYIPYKDTKITIEGFYKYYKHYPFSVTDSISLAHRMIDFGTLGDEELIPKSEGQAYGVELFIRSRINKSINILLSYTYAISEFKDKKGNFQPTGWDNRHIFTTTISKKFKKGWNAGLKWRFAGGLPYTPYDYTQSEIITAWNINGGPFYDYDLLNSNRLKPFHQLDIRIDKVFYFDKSSLKFYLDIQNAYNYKADEQARLTNLDENGNPVINPSNPNLYILRTIESDGSGTVIPTLGIIFDF
ncbi:MAG: TonB-dependent receptor [Marinilabiliales bacterium]